MQVMLLQSCGPLNKKTMNKEYLERNAKGYEGDTFVHEEIKKLVDRFGVNMIFETGTYFGATTLRLSEFAPVYSAEINKTNFDKACKMIAEKRDYIKIVHSNSVDMLQHQVKNFLDMNCLFFLDAHWEDYWPLLDELKVIAENKLKPVIIIHDFQVPGKDFGYDSYKGTPLNFDYIKAGIEEIYGVDGYDYHYNSEADGARRGVIYIYPKDGK